MIDSIPTATASPPASARPAAGGGFGSGADFDTFLKMLTAQLKTQDPLNPMEGTDFAVQLATFAGVEQQAQTNKLLEKMAGSGGTAGLGQVADWIGKEARTTAPVWFADKALTLDVTPHVAADHVMLIARNAAGREVAREDIGTGTGQIDWLGRDDAGAKLPDGRYSFTIESLREGQVIATVPVGAYARIIEAETGANGVELILEGGARAPAESVQALRNPS